MNIKRLTIVAVALMSLCFTRAAQADEWDRLCNVGSIPFDAAAAAEVTEGNDFFPVKTFYVRGWWTIQPGDCFKLGDAGYINGRMRQVQLLFAATNKAGQWGYVTVGSGLWGSSDVKVCVAGKGKTFNYKVKVEEAASKCEGYLVPASFVYDFNAGRGVDIKFDESVAVTPLGASNTTGPPRPSSAASPPNIDLTKLDGSSERFGNVLMAIFNMANIYHSYSVTGRWDACVAPALLARYNSPDQVVALEDALFKAANDFFERFQDGLKGGVSFRMLVVAADDGVSMVPTKGSCSEFHYPSVGSSVVR